VLRGSAISLLGSADRSARSFSETSTCVVNYSGEIGYGLIQVIVDHGRVDDLPARLDLIAAERDAPCDVLGRVATRPETGFLHLDRGRHEQDTEHVVREFEDLARTLEVDLEDEIPALEGLGHRGAVVGVENLRPLEETAGSDSRLERLGVDEGVRVEVFAWTTLARRPGAREPKSRVSFDQSADDGPFAGTTGAGEDDDQGTSAWRRTALRALDGLEQRLALLGAEALEAAGLRDADLLHQTTGLDLAGTRQRFEHCEHFHLADRVVSFRSAEKFLQRRTTGLQVIFDLGAGFASQGCLLKCGLALFGCENGRLRHESVR